MSKMIKMTPAMLAECKSEFEAAAAGAKISDGKLTFIKTFAADDRKATVFFTADAWAKMVILLDRFSKEIAWHGVASRVGADGSNQYLISDILVYPQEVGYTTVEMDTEAYAKWIVEHDGDDRFDNIHMQGHSHVNMPTSPSSVDLAHQAEILAQLSDDGFYIFMIYNKRFERNIKIYDMRDNALFDDAEVVVKMYGAEESFDEFLASAKELVRDKSYCPSTTSSLPKGGTTPSSPSPYNPPTSTGPQKPSDKPKGRIGAGWRGQRDCVDDLDDDPYDNYRGGGYQYGG